MQFIVIRAMAIYFSHCCETLQIRLALIQIQIGFWLSSPKQDATRRVLRSNVVHVTGSWVSTLMSVLSDFRILLIINFILNIDLSR